MGHGSQALILYSLINDQLHLASAPTYHISATCDRLIYQRQELGLSGFGIKVKAVGIVTGRISGSLRQWDLSGLKLLQREKRKGAFFRQTAAPGI